MRLSPTRTPAEHRVRKPLWLRAAPHRQPSVCELMEWAWELLPESGYVACVLRSVHRLKANWGEARWRELALALPDVQFVALDPDPHPNVEVRGSYEGPRFYDLPNVLPLPEREPLRPG